MRILSELVFIPKRQESIGCCMNSPIFDFLHRAVVFIFNQMLSIQAFGRRVIIHDGEERLSNCT